MNRPRVLYGVLAAGVAVNLLASLVVAKVHADLEEAVSQRPCLNYYAVGDSGACEQPKKAKKPAQKAAKPPSPTAVAAPPAEKPELDKKIDEFLANHGKPPREFVAFYLEPTPEHAIEWVAKYNELLNRGQDIAVAWTQAEKLYNDALMAGVTSSTLNPTALPSVPDFGIPVPGFNTPAYTQLMSSSTIPVMPAVLDVPPPPARPVAAADAAAATGLLRPVDASPATPGKPLEISYYFSGICPYCKKFEPDFAKVLQEIGPSVILTCVDVTPEISGNTRSPDNIGDRLPCSWRPATEEELSGLKIRQTPSLIINRGDDKPLELVSGYVEPGKLKNYLENIRKRTD